LARKRTIRRVQASRAVSRANDVGDACGVPHGTLAARPANVSARLARATSTQIDIGLTFLARCVTWDDYPTAQMGRGRASVPRHGIVASEAVQVGAGPPFS
jgi:hypothetical protein